MEKRRAGKAIWVVLLLCVVACAQTASFTCAHSHRYWSEHCCQLCHLGPLPLLQPAASGTGSPILAVAWLERSGDLSAAHETHPSAGSSRAPPA
jgi:hypothetical protein